MRVWVGPDGPRSAAMAAEDRVRTLVERWRSLRSRGEQTTVEDLCRDCPDLIEPVRRAIGAARPDRRDQTTAETRAPSGTTAFDLSTDLPDDFDTPGWVRSCLGPAQGPGEIGRL